MTRLTDGAHLQRVLSSSFRPSPVNNVGLVALAVASILLGTPSRATPTLSEVTEHLSQPPIVLQAKYIKYYPDKPSIPWEFFELHIQANNYILRRHQASGAGAVHWIPSTAEPEITVRIDEVRWTYTPDDRAVIYYDPVALGFRVDAANPVLEADKLAVLEINNVLNLGITYADRKGIEVQGNEFRGTNQAEGHAIAGTFLTSGTTVVDGVNLLLRLADERFPAPREFHWEIAYAGDLSPEDFRVYPAEIHYALRQSDGTRKPLESVRLLEARSAAPLSPEEFRPRAHLGTNFSYFYTVHSQGRLFYTNALGQIGYKGSKGKLDNFFERQKSIRRIFPFVVVTIAIVAFFLYRRGSRNAN